MTAIHRSPSAGSLGPLLRRFDVTRADQRSIGLIRLAAAVLAGGSAVLLLLAEVTVPVFLAALLGVLMSLVWFGQARRALRLSRAAEAHHLCIHQSGFVLSEGDKITTLRFDAIHDIALDEERLDIVVTPKQGTPVRLEPRYAGVEINELVRSLREAWHNEAHM